MWEKEWRVIEKRRKRRFVTCNHGWGSRKIEKGGMRVREKSWEELGLKERARTIRNQTCSCGLSRLYSWGRDGYLAHFFSSGLGSGRLINHIRPNKVGRYFFIMLFKKKNCKMEFLMHPLLPHPLENIFIF